jgi:hypothetical protein
MNLLRMRRLIGPIIALLTPAVHLPSSYANIGQNQVDGNEHEVKLLQSNLRELNQLLRAIRRTATEPGLGPQLTESKRALRLAQNAFRSNEWPMVIQESVKYLNLSQKPDVHEYLKAQYMLGRAYEEQGQPLRAIRAYRRYLATFTTNPKTDISYLTDVFERLIRLTTKDNPTSQSELAKFLSSIASINYPDEIGAELKYLAAIAGSNIGKSSLATDWLHTVTVEASNPETKARAHQYKALIAIHKKDYEAAERELESILTLEPLSQKTKDTTLLALARIYVRQKKPQLGLAAYNKIHEASDSYKDALYEKSLVNAKLGNEESSRKEARAWLAKYQGEPESSQLKGILSWLELRTGNFESARSSIQQSAQVLSSTMEKLQSLAGRPALTYQDTTAISNLTHGLTGQSPDLGSYIGIYTQIAEMKGRLLELDGMERSTITNLANGDLRSFSPSIANRIEQYERITDQILNIGSKLASAEKSRLADQLNDVDKQRLSASEHRRLALFERRAKFERHLRRWKTWLGPAEQLSKLSVKWTKLNQLEAQASAALLSSPDARTADVKLIKEKSASLRSDLMKILSEIKVHQAINIISQSGIDDILSIVQAYASALHEESQIISKYEPNSGRILETLADEDSQLSWTLWRDVVNLLYVDIQALRTEAQQKLSKTTQLLSQIGKKRAELEGHLLDLQAVTETFGGEDLPMILSYYDNQLNQRLARQFKWSGDLEYLSYVSVKTEQETSGKKLALERQILDDTLRSLGE